MPEGGLDALREKLDRIGGLPAGGATAPIPTDLQKAAAPARAQAISEAGIKVPQLITPLMAAPTVDWNDESLDFRRKVSDTLNAMPEQLRGKVQIESGYRSNAEQAEIYERSEQGKKFMAAPPGKSLHERGVAADLKFTDRDAEKAFREAAAANGLVFPFPDRDPNHMQLAGAQALATREVVDQKRGGSLEDLQAKLDHLNTGVSSSRLAEDEPDNDALDYVDPLDQAPSDTGVPAQAFLAGAAAGSVHTVTGPIQTGLQVANDEAARGFTNQVNDWEERLGMTEQAKRDPLAFQVGEAVGSVATILGSAGLLEGVGVGEYVGQAMGYLPRLARGAAVGFAAGATTFHRDLDEANRWIEGVFGATLGAGAQATAQAFIWGTRYLSKVDAVQKMIATLQGSVGQVTKNVNDVKNILMEHYRGVTAESTAKYGLSREAGGQFAGYDAEKMAQALRDAEEQSGRHGVATVVTQGAVKDELGLDAHEAAKRAHEWAQEEYRRGEDKWQKAADKLGINNYPQAVREKIIQEMAHVLPPRPVDPGAFVPKPVDPMAYAAARQSINRSIGRAERSGDVQAQGQLRIMKRHLTEAAAEQAKDLGMSAAEFARKMDEADKFFAENIGPIRDFFNRATPEQLLNKRKFTTAKVWNKVSAIIKSNDVEEMAMLGKALGPRAKEAMTQVVETEMLKTLTEGMKGRVPQGRAAERFAKYIKDRKEGLIQMVGRQHVEELEGLANMAQQMVTERGVSKLWGWGTHSFLPFIGAERVFEGAVSGDVRKMAHGAGLIAAPFAVHALHNVFVKLRQLPYVMPLVRSAATYKPGTPEFERVMRQIEMRAIGVGAVGGREAVERQSTLTEVPQ